MFKMKEKEKELSSVDFPYKGTCINGQLSIAITSNQKPVESLLSLSFYCSNVPIKNRHAMINNIMITLCWPDRKSNLCRQPYRRYFALMRENTKKRLYCFFT